MTLSEERTVCRDRALALVRERRRKEQTGLPRGQVFLGMMQECVNRYCCADGGSASVDGGNGVGKFSRGRDFGAISHLLVDRRLQVAFVMLARLGLSLPRSGVISLSLQKAASPHFLNGAAGENQCYYYCQPCDRLPTYKTCQ